jgi:molybdate transport system substrate-binding protein
MVFARGRLALCARSDSEIRIATLNHLSFPQVKRIAFANLEQAPYAKAAEEVLRSISIWDAFREKLVYNENVGQAFQFAEIGNVDAAFISSSLVPRSNGKTISVDPCYHAPINQ